MKKLLLASAIAGLSVGLSTPTLAANSYEQYQAAIDQRSDSGISGMATFIPKGDKEMKVELEMKDADGMSAGLHAGLCRYADDGKDAPEDLAFNKEPAVELSEVDGGKSSTTIELSVENLMNEPHAVAIHDGDKVVACGNIQ